MRRLLTTMTVLASAAVAYMPAFCGAGEAVDQTKNDATQILGQGKPIHAADKKADVKRPILRSRAEKRRWLREQLTSSVKDRRQIQQLLAKIDNLAPQQVNELTKAALAQQLPGANQQQQVQQGLQQFDLQQQQLLQQANQELARAQFIRQALENELWWRNAGYGVGYMPVVTWLPEGTWFGAGANISPDGRYVRTTANPFFSSVGPVYSYNLNTGETRQWMPQSGYQTNTQSSGNNLPLGSPGFDHATTYGGIPSWHPK
jgi:hypothetical protein